MLIPTAYKAALPRHLSYPVGAEAVSRALADSPHLSELRLSFHDQVVWPASASQQILKNRHPNDFAVEVLVAEQPQHRGFSGLSSSQQSSADLSKIALPKFDLLANLMGQSFSLREIRLDFVLMAQVVGHHGVNFGESRGRITLDDGLGRCAVLKSLNDQFEEHSGLTDSQSA